MRTHHHLLLVLFVACSGGDPLGGPYGGTSNPPGPNGQHTADPNSPNAPDDAGGNPNTADDAGVIQNAKDAATKNNSADSGQVQQPQAPTWTQIWTAYLQSGTQGNCKSSCHTQMGAPSSSYTWLKSRGYISGSSAALIDPAQSCLSWYGGNMPPNGPGSWSAAETDMSAWAKAGAKNN